jgi:hypothetical protein
MNLKLSVEEDLQWKMFYQHGRLREQNGIINFEQNGIMEGY